MYYTTSLNYIRSEANMVIESIEGSKDNQLQLDLDSKTDKERIEETLRVVIAMVDLLQDGADKFLPPKEYSEQIEDAFATALKYSKVGKELTKANEELIKENQRLRSELFISQTMNSVLRPLTAEEENSYGTRK